MNSDVKVIRSQYQKKQEWRWALAVILMLGAFAVRVWDLSARSLWFDEAIEYWVALSPIADIGSNLKLVLKDPPLFSLILHFWIRLDPGEFGLRFLSVLFSVASVAGIISIGRKLGGWSGGLVGGMIMTLMPSQIRYAQEVGQYAIMQCLLVMSLKALLRLTVRTNWSDFFCWGILAVLATYSYYGTVFPLIVPFGMLSCESLIKRKWQFIEKAFATLACYVILIAPLLFYLLPSQISPGRVGGAFGFEFGSPVIEPHTWLDTTQELVAFQFAGFPWSDIPAWVPSILVLVSLLLSIRSQPRLLLWLVSTGFVYYLVARVGIYPYRFRYGIILAPLLVTVIADKLSTSFRTKYRRPVAVLAVTSMVAICLVSIPNRTLRDLLYANRNWAWPETQDMGRVMTNWMQNRNGREPTYVYYGAAPAFAYYLQQYSQVDIDQPPAWFIECWFNTGPDYCRANGIYYGQWTRPFSQREKILSTHNTLSYTPETLWVVFSHVYPGEDDMILSGLSSEYEIVVAYKKTNAAAYLLKAK